MPHKCVLVLIYSEFCFYFVNAQVGLYDMNFWSLWSERRDSWTRVALITFVSRVYHVIAQPGRVGSRASAQLTMARWLYLPFPLYRSLHGGPG